ncbi:MAG: aminotransferase class I/II-fold pyridoxal phosphate-dependent enzyme, partial [Candidatus Sumerlaeota bacterium]|nr:aminotransferase class I/II-fold pyridoxal phosphate-dependent enzyme [Candidatus Sumerlaeota bacterium]
MTLSVGQKTRIARVVREMPPSGIREFFELTIGMDDIVSLGVGEPDFATPWTIREAAIYAIERGRTSYTSNWGLIDLRREIAKYLETRFGLHYNPENEILRLIGSKEGIAHIALAVLNPGDLAIVPDPGYPVYKISVMFAGAES